MIAVRSKSVEVVKALVQIISADQLSAEDDRGRTLIHLACEAGSIEIVQLLLNGGASLDVEDNEGLKP